MAVDIRLNQLINEMDDRLWNIRLEDVELSIRSFNALRKLGVRNLGEAQQALINQKFKKQHGIGPRAVKEVAEIILNVSAILPPKPTRNRERELKEVLEMFLSWTGALAVTGSVTPDAWRELVVIRDRAEKATKDEA